MLSSPAPFAHP